MRRAIVTGGSRGIGAGIVRALVSAGYFVHFTFRTSRTQANFLEKELAGRCKGSAVDGVDIELVDEYCALVSRDGPVDILVHNAGVERSVLLDRENTEDIVQFFTQHLAAMHAYNRHFIAEMRRQRRGDIICISSLAAHNVRVGNGAYGTLKAAIERYAQGLAFENARFGICVNVIAPGFVDTDMTRSLLADASGRELIAQIPTRRLTTIAEVVEGVLLFAKREPPLYGVVLPIGGGAQL